VVRASDLRSRDREFDSQPGEEESNVNGNNHYCDTKAAITIVIRLRFDFDSATMKNEHVHFYVASRGVAANKKAAVGAYHDAIVYVTVVTRMAFTLTDEHRVASFDSRRWYSLFTHFRSRMSSGMNLCLHYHTVMMPISTSHIEVESQSNRNCNSRLRLPLSKQSIKVMFPVHLIPP